MPTAANMPVADAAYSDDDLVSAERNDKLLLFSMIGVVIMTIAALGYAYFTRTQDAVIATPQPVVATPLEVEPAPAPQQNQVLRREEPAVPQRLPVPEAPPVEPMSTVVPQPSPRVTQDSTYVRRSPKVKSSVEDGSIN